MFAIFASLRIKPDQRDSFLATIKNTAACSARDELGCLRFDVFRDDGDENHYLLYEVYSDEAAFESHLTTPHAQRAMEGAKPGATRYSKLPALAVFFRMISYPSRLQRR